MNGVVIKSTGSWYEVRNTIGEVVKCRLKGIFRLDESKEKDSNPIAVGDRVVLERTDSGDLTIAEIEPRDNYILRSSPKHKGARQIIAANIDQALLIVTMANPRTSTGFIDRFLLTAEAYHIPVVIVFNKQDLLDVKTQKKQEYVASIYQNIGYKTLFVSALNREHIDEVQALMKNKTSCTTRCLIPLKIFTAKSWCFSLPKKEKMETNYLLKILLAPALAPLCIRIGCRTNASLL